MHTHHSHLGDYVSHATGTLEHMVETAQLKSFEVFCLTEHMPRLHEKYLYPEEIDKLYTPKHLDKAFSDYLIHARDVQKRVNEKNGMKILVGFEVEGLDKPHIDLAKQFAKVTDMCVGSVHYVHGIPIDFDVKQWEAARDVSGSTRQLYLDYFDLQYKVLTAMDPHVIGHFDLIRLFQPDEVDEKSGRKVLDLDLEADWPDVWAAIERNIKYASKYGALFELNSAAIRKGWQTAYPKPDICKLIIKSGGKFCLSDDSHSYAQVGLNFHKVWTYVTETLKLESIYHLDLDAEGNTIVVERNVAELSKLPFWDQYENN